MKIHLRGINGQIDQIDENSLRISVSDPKMLKTYRSTYIVPIHDLSRWIRLLEINSTADGGISFGDWFE